MLAERAIPAQHIDFGDGYISPAVAGQVDEAQIGVGPIEIRERRQRFEGVPALLMLKRT